jgi:3-oxoacyl-[acyl-carrier protein] reductase
MRNIIVTGASRGFGLAIAGALAQDGARVIAVARSESAELRAAAEVRAREQHGAIEFRRFDLAETAGIGELVGALRKEFGPLYGLVNNAGLGTAGQLTLMKDADVEQLLKVNVLAAILLSKYAVRSMMLERAGRIVNISSIVSATGYAGLAAYAATKAALSGFTRSLARDVGALGITVNAVAPGFAATDMTRELDAAQREQIARRSALRRLITPQDVAGAVQFLMSEAAANITGTTLTVDAGNTA